MSLATRIAQEFNNVRSHISGIAAYHLLQGNLYVSNEVITNGFSTILYTGNGGTQSVNTGIDMSTQHGDDVSETYGGLSWVKSRSMANGHQLYDTVRGATKVLYSQLNYAEAIEVTGLTSFNNNGFTIGSLAGVNQNASNQVSWNFQTTHRRTGVTNHGKAFTEHYNPFTGFTIIKYEGSGIAGHEIPHSLSRKLGFVVTKNLAVAENWYASNFDSIGAMALNLTDKLGQEYGQTFSSTENSITTSTAIITNSSGNQHIMYGWANSYLDESNKLIGNYEVGVYQGTGVAGNKVKTRGKPAWCMVKRLDTAGNWEIYDNQRATKLVQANTSNAEATNDAFAFDNNSFTCKLTTGGTNASGGQYLYMVVYDNDSGSGKSKYPRATDTSNLTINNAIIPLAHGVDNNGSKNTIVIANETITGLTYTSGKNYVYAKNDGTYGVKAIAPSYGKDNPLTGDFYNILTNKWYSNTNTEITESRNYLNHIVHADQNGQVSYVEELPKIEYKDIIKANKYLGSNAVSLSVAFDLTTTPITIKGKIIGAKALIRTNAGVVDIYLDDNLKGIELKLDGITSGNQVRVLAITDDKITIETSNSSGTATSYTYTSINGVGE